MSNSITYYPTESKCTSGIIMLVINKEDWAPGIWAGAEDAEVTLTGRIYTVDLNTKTLFLNINTVKLSNPIVIIDGRE